MEVGEFLAVPANREAVRAVALRVTAALNEPGGRKLELGWLEAVLDRAAEGKVLAVDPWDHAGRFGSLGYLINVVVPVVAAALARAGTTRARVSREEIRSVVAQTRSSKALKRIEDLERLINAALLAREPSAPVAESEP